MVQLRELGFEQAAMPLIPGPAAGAGVPSAGAGLPALPHQLMY